MRIVALVSRVLLGLTFTVFGLNGFFNFIHQPPPPPLAGQFVGALVQSHYMAFVFVLEIVGGVLLLANRYVPLALTILAPIIVNIVLFHVTMAPAGLPLASLVTILWLLVFSRARNAFAGILSPLPAAR